MTSGVSLAHQRKHKGCHGPLEGHCCTLLGVKGLGRERGRGRLEGQGVTLSRLGVQVRERGGLELRLCLRVCLRLREGEGLLQALDEVEVTPVLDQVHLAALRSTRNGMG